MNTKTITVASVEWPQAGKKMGAVIDSMGERWGVWPDKLPGYQQFRTYEIRYKSNDFKGKTYYTIETATPINGTGTVTGLIVPKAVPPPAPASRGYDDDQRRMDIFVSVLINNSKFDPASSPEQEMVDVVLKFKRIWKRVYGPQAQETKPAGELDDDFGDSIPFR